MVVRSAAVFSLTAFIVMAGCNKSSTSEKKESTETTTKVDDPIDEVEAGNVAITTADKALLYVQTAVESSAELSTEISAVSAGTLAISLTESTEGDDPNCYEGTPRNDAEKVYIMPGSTRLGEVNERAPYYASGLWYCHLKHVIPSAFADAARFSCAVGDLPFDGTVSDKEMTLDVNGSACFGTMEDEVPAKVNALVSATKLDEEERGFDKHLKIAIAAGQVGESAMEINILLKITDKTIAFSTWEAKDNVKQGTAARLDMQTGEIRYLDFEDTTGTTDEETRIRNRRMYLKGTFDDKGKYTEIDRMEGLLAEIFLRKNTNNYSTRFVSMAGNIKDGVKTKNYGAPLGEAIIGTILPLSIIPDLDMYDWPNGVESGGELRETPRPGCFGAPNVTCANNPGIALTEDNYKKFFLFPKATFVDSPISVDALTWFSAKAAFLNFEAGALADAF